MAISLLRTRETCTIPRTCALSRCSCAVARPARGSGEAWLGSSRRGLRRASVHILIAARGTIPGGVRRRDLPFEFGFGFSFGFALLSETVARIVSLCIHMYAHTYDESYGTRTRKDARAICDSGSDSDSRPRCVALCCVVPPPLAHTSLTRSSTFHTPSRGKTDPRAPARGLAPRHTLRPQSYSQRWHCRMDDGARGLSRSSAKRVSDFFRSVTLHKHATR